MTEPVSTTSVMHLHIDEHYRSEIKAHSLDNGASVMLSYCGTLTRDLINGLTETIENLLISSGTQKKTVKRIFSILIEGLQNILVHGEHDDEGNQPAFLILINKTDHFEIFFGNMVNVSEAENLKAYLDKLNNLEEEALKGMYMEVLNNNIFSAKGGAGLGFLTMRMKSENKLSYKFTLLNEQHLFFNAKVLVQKIL